LEELPIQRSNLPSTETFKDLSIKLKENRYYYQNESVSTQFDDKRITLRGYVMASPKRNIFNGKTGKFIKFDLSVLLSFIYSLGLKTQSTIGLRLNLMCIAIEKTPCYPLLFQGRSSSFQTFIQRLHSISRSS